MQPYLTHNFKLLSVNENSFHVVSTNTGEEKFCCLPFDLTCGLLGVSGSCPNLMMSRSDHADARPVPVALTPQLPARAHRPLCVSVSSDSSGRFKALETQEWKNNLKAQVHKHLLLCPQQELRYIWILKHLHIKKKRRF